MPSDVYTCTEFPARLPRLLQRHPRAVTLVLQLCPVASPSDARRRASLTGSDACSAPTSVGGVSDTSSDFVTLYAVLLRRPEREAEDTEGGRPSLPIPDPSPTVASGDKRVEEVFVVVGHASHLSLRWCAELQHYLSVSSLLLTEWYTSGEFNVELGAGGRDDWTATHRRSGLFAGVTQLQVRLAPYVPLLHWDRHVDGVLGSHHVVCASHRCLLRGAGGIAEDGDAGAAFGGSVGAETEEAGLSEQSHSFTSLLPKAGRVAHQAQPPPPTDGSVTEAAGAVLPFPFRVAAILNGSVPLPQEPAAAGCISVLFLVARDGCALTGASAGSSSFSWPSSAATTTESAFDVLCDFLSGSVVPAVKLDVVDGTWVCDGAGVVLRDVCKTRDRLGSSYAIRVTHRARQQQLEARSIIFVVDFSTPLYDALALATRTSASPAVSQQRSAAQQVAAAVQETLGRLVSANVDAFSFSPRGRRDSDTAATAEAADEDAILIAGSAPAQVLTREMLCRSIAESVSRIVAISPHPEFKAEVVRLLWGTEGEVTRRGAQPSASAIQRRIEERLRSVSTD